MSEGFQVGVSATKPAESTTVSHTDSVSSSPLEHKSFYKLPGYTQFSTSPTVAAGVPVLELIRKFEEEKILSRDDRVCLNEAIYNPERREAVVKALRDIEISVNSRFAIKRLKALIHQNGTGEVSSRYLKNQKKTTDAGVTSPVARQLGIPNNNELLMGTGTPRTSRDGSKNKDSPSTSPTRSQAVAAGGKAVAGPNEGALNEPQASISPKRTGNSKSVNRRRANREGDEQSVAGSVALTNTNAAIEKVVGMYPMYVNADHFNVCTKIMKRLRDFLRKYKPSAMGQRKFAIIIGSGSFNPLTRMHLRSYFVAKQYLEAKCGFIVLGSLLSPAHGMTVRERYRTNQNEIIPSPHRLAISQLLVEESKWLTIDPWEITRRRPMDYLSLLQHASETMKSTFPDIDIKILYLAKANAVPKISPSALKSENFGVVSVCRAAEYDMIKRSLSARWNGLIWCVEDTAVLDASMDIVTSRKVREKIRRSRPIANLVGDAIDIYAKTHMLADKMNGIEDWTEDEKNLPEIPSRPAVQYLRSQLINTSFSTSIVSSPGSPGFDRGGTGNNSPYTPSWSSPHSNAIARKKFMGNTPLGGNANVNTSIDKTVIAEAEVTAADRKETESCRGMQGMQGSESAPVIEITKQLPVSNITVQSSLAIQTTDI